MEGDISHVGGFGAALVLTALPPSSSSPGWNRSPGCSWQRRSPRCPWWARSPRPCWCCWSCC